MAFLCSQLQVAVETQSPNQVLLEYRSAALSIAAASLRTRRPE